MHKKSLWTLLLVVILIFSLAACNNNNDGAGEMNRYNTSPDNWDNPRNNNFTSNHNNTRMEMSEEIAEEITKMKEVDAAYVLLTDRNAYVAVVLEDNNRRNGNNNGNNGNMNNGNRNNGRMDNGVMNDNNGLFNGSNNGLGLGRGGDLGTRDMNMSDNYKGTSIRGTDGLNNRGVEDQRMQADISNHVKQKIAKKVKSVKPNVQNVYVSANPDFVDRMTGYSERFNNGQPLRGMIIEFNTMVERIFPTNAANDQAPILRNMNPVK